VAAVESWGFQPVRRLRPDDTESDNILLIAPHADTKMLQPTLLEGRWLRPNDTNAIVINTDLLADEPDLILGDELVLKFGRRETSWQIVGVVQGILVGPFAYSNYPYYAQVVRDVGKAGSVQIVTAQQDGATQLEIARALEEQFQRSGLKVTSINTIADLRDTVVFQFNILTSFLLVMAVVLAIVGGLGLTGTMSINVLERVREIGVMRAIGASDGTVLRLVMVEGTLIGLLSWLVGGMVAFPVSKLLSNQIGLQLFQSPLSYTFSISGMVIWLVIVVVLASLASFLPARGASRLTVREVLAYE
jgi:putative ABC transport system permease protein